MTVSRKVSSRNHCGECGQYVGIGMVFHPYLYCLLYKAGINDQEAYLRSSGFVRQEASCGAD